MKNMKKQLIDLLNIHATSGNEKPVRDYLIIEMSKLVNKMQVDNYGNLLAEKTCGTGKGATVLLSAHMDTVRGVQANKKLVEKNGKISAVLPNGASGVLGADDRAGIAIILTVLRNISSTNFNGTIKVAFSREEEIGCVGADKIDPKWYEDTDLAIVVDRRGNRDIVVGCGGAFCCDEVGNFMEEVAKMADMPDWKAKEGGVSDAMTFSSNGVNSINLSAGYYNEHTDKEYVVLSQMKDTTRLILQAIAVINDIAHTFCEVPHENQWVQAWYPKSTKGGYSNQGMYNAYGVEIEEDIYAEEYDKNGDVYVYEMGMNTVAITQGNNEILMSKESLKSIFEQIKHLL
jgi:putative aminopeptidase FrvX